MFRLRSTEPPRGTASLRLVQFNCCCRWTLSNPNTSLPREFSCPWSPCQIDFRRLEHTIDQSPISLQCVSPWLESYSSCWTSPLVDETIDAVVPGDSERSSLSCLVKKKLFYFDELILLILPIMWWTWSHNQCNKPES